jgi:hypothetical protein
VSGSSHAYTRRVRLLIAVLVKDWCGSMVLSRVPGLVLLIAKVEKIHTAGMLKAPTSRFVIYCKRTQYL